MVLPFFARGTEACVPKFGNAVGLVRKTEKAGEWLRPFAASLPEFVGVEISGDVVVLNDEPRIDGERVMCILGAAVHHVML